MGGGGSRGRLLWRYYYRRPYLIRLLCEAITSRELVAISFLAVDWRMIFALDPHMVYILAQIVSAAALIFRSIR